MRKFHEYRDEARGMTAGLCALLAVAVVGTVVVSALALAGISVASTYAYLSATTNIKMPAEHWRGVFFARLGEAGALTTLLVGGAAVYTWFRLADGGGGWVARSLGGTRVTVDTADPAQKRLINVVEELAIATSLRVPKVYLLENESAINAFAAGLNDKDAVIGVTRGALDRLQRQQLQGVIAHEFSHIANGDMRLNLQLLGVLSGVQAIAFVARYLIRLGTTVSSNAGASGQPGSSRQSGRGKHPLGMVLAVAFGAAIWPIGQIGSLFALMINRAVNRQREFLADACAVQYTRDPQGLREALELLLADDAGNRLCGGGARLASHMFFASNGGAWQRLFQTHPSLAERISRLDPATVTPRETDLPPSEFDSRPSEFTVQQT
jgi:Zn-dependent protease with chaperone function